MSSATRMRAEDRREQLLAAATTVFGARGYVGTTTDAVAKAAGVSQPYVVRTFGTKEALFIATIDHCLQQLIAVFRASFAVSDPVVRHRTTGTAYLEFASEHPGVILSLMHAFVLGADPAIGPAARRGWGKLYRFLRDEGGFTPEQSVGFLQGGMYLNTLLGLRLVVDYDSDPEIRELLDASFPSKLELFRRASQPEQA